MSDIGYYLINAGTPTGKNCPLGYLAPINGTWALGPVRWDGRPETADTALIGGRLLSGLTPEVLAGALIYPLNPSMQGLVSGKPAATVKVNDSIVGWTDEVLAHRKTSQQALECQAEGLAKELQAGLAALVSV